MNNPTANGTKLFSESPLPDLPAHAVDPRKEIYLNNPLALLVDKVSSYMQTLGLLLHPAGRPMACVRNPGELEATWERLERAMRDLGEAVGPGETRPALFPICSYCKKIRNGDGLWEQVENHLSPCNDGRFTHGICPECTERHYPEYAARMRRRLAKKPASPPPARDI